MPGGKKIDFGLFARWQRVIKPGGVLAAVQEVSPEGPQAEVAQQVLSEGIHHDTPHQEDDHVSTTVVLEDLQRDHTVLHTPASSPAHEGQHFSPPSSPLSIHIGSPAVSHPHFQEDFITKVTDFMASSARHQEKTQQMLQSIFDRLQQGEKPAGIAPEPAGLAEPVTNIAENIQASPAQTAVRHVGTQTDEFVFLVQASHGIQVDRSYSASASAVRSKTEELKSASSEEVSNALQSPFQYETISEHDIVLKEFPTIGWADVSKPEEPDIALRKSKTNWPYAGSTRSRIWFWGGRPTWAESLHFGLSPSSDAWDRWPKKVSLSPAAAGPSKTKRKTWEDYSKEERKSYKKMKKQKLYYEEHIPKLLPQDENPPVQQDEPDLALQEVIREIQEGQIKEAEEAEEELQKKVSEFKARLQGTYKEPEPKTVAEKLIRKYKEKHSSAVFVTPTERPRNLGLGAEDIAGPSRPIFVRPTATSEEVLSPSPLNVHNSRFEEDVQRQNWEHKIRKTKRVSSRISRFLAPKLQMIVYNPLNLKDISDRENAKKQD